jgi:hypothetical protein
VGWRAKAAAGDWWSPTKMEAVMTYFSWHHGSPTLVHQVGDRLAPNAKRWDRFVAVLANPDFAAIVTICAVGLLLTFVLFLLVPSSREIPTSIQQML